MPKRQIFEPFIVDFKWTADGPVLLEMSNALDSMFTGYDKAAKIHGLMHHKLVMALLEYAASIGREIYVDPLERHIGRDYIREYEFTSEKDLGHKIATGELEKGIALFRALPFRLGTSEPYPCTAALSSINAIQKPGVTVVGGHLNAVGHDKVVFGAYCERATIRTPKTFLISFGMSKDLLPQCMREIASERFIIKPTDATEGRGVTVCSRENLLEVLKWIETDDAQETPECVMHDDTFVEYWRKKRTWKEISEDFIGFQEEIGILVQEYIPSEPEEIIGQKYDLTYRAVFIAQQTMGQDDFTLKMVDVFGSRPKTSMEDDPQNFSRMGRVSGVIQDNDDVSLTYCVQLSEEKKVEIRHALLPMMQKLVLELLTVNPTALWTSLLPESENDKQFFGAGAELSQASQRLSYLVKAVPFKFFIEPLSLHEAKKVEWLLMASSHNTLRKNLIRMIYAHGLSLEIDAQRSSLLLRGCLPQDESLPQGERLLYPLVRLFVRALPEDFELRILCLERLLIALQKILKGVARCEEVGRQIRSMGKERSFEKFESETDSIVLEYLKSKEDQGALRKYIAVYVMMRSHFLGMPASGEMKEDGLRRIMYKHLSALVPITKYALEQIGEENLDKTCQLLKNELEGMGIKFGLEQHDMEVANVYMHWPSSSFASPSLTVSAHSRAVTSTEQHDQGQGVRLGARGW